MLFSLSTTAKLCFEVRSMVYEEVVDSVNDRWPYLAKFQNDVCPNVVFAFPINCEVFHFVPLTFRGYAYII